MESWKLFSFGISFFIHSSLFSVQLIQCFHLVFFLVNNNFTGVLAILESTTYLADFPIILCG